MDGRKVNTDASYSVPTRIGSTGVVLRDEKGDVLAAARFYSNVADVLMAEALADKMEYTTIENVFRDG